MGEKEIIKISEYECHIIDKETGESVTIDDLTFDFIGRRMNWVKKVDFNESNKIQSPLF